MSALNDARDKRRKAQATRSARPHSTSLQPRPSPNPQPVRVAEYRPFPLHALPPVLREYVIEVASSVGCDPAFAALPALTVAGAAIGAALVIRAKRGYDQPPLLWLLTVGDSGTGKSPAFKPAADQAFRIDRHLKDEYTAALRKYKADMEAWEAEEVPDPEKKPVQPIRERFAVIDATIERLTVESTTSPRGLVLLRDEADGWLSSFARYKGKAGGSDMPNWLSLYEAGPVRYMRRTGEPREVEADRAFVAVCGGIQPDILKLTLSDPSFLSSGLAARIGFAMPPKACLKWSDVEPSDGTERAFADVLSFLRKLPFDPKNGPSHVNLDVNALARFKRLNDEFADAAENLDGGPMAAVLPKAVRFALRLALVWHCVNEAAVGRDPGKGCITDEAMAAGEELARWFVHEAARVYAVLAERPEDRSNRILADWVRRKGGQVRPRQLQRSNPQKYPTAELAELALEGLASTGFGEWNDSPPGPDGGRPSRIFVLHDATTPDTRQNPTERADGIDSTTETVSDTTTVAPLEKAKISGDFKVVSGSVGCRVNSASALPKEASSDPIGRVVSGTSQTKPVSQPAAPTDRLMHTPAASVDDLLADLPALLFRSEMTWSDVLRWFDEQDEYVPAEGGVSALTRPQKMLLITMLTEIVGEKLGERERS